MYVTSDTNTNNIIIIIITINNNNNNNNNTKQLKYVAVVVLVVLGLSAAASDETDGGGGSSNSSIKVGGAHVKGTQSLQYLSEVLVLVENDLFLIYGYIFFYVATMNKLNLKF